MTSPASAAVTGTNSIANNANLPIRNTQFQEEIPKPDFLSRSGLRKCAKAIFKFLSSDNFIFTAGAILFFTGLGLSLAFGGPIAMGIYFFVVFLIGAKIDMIRKGN